MDINLNEASAKSELVSGIRELIAQEVEELKKKILSIPAEKRSYFDIIKNWWSNLVHGNNDSNNPYIHRNRLGALGLKEYNLNKKEELKFILETVELLAEEQASKTKFEVILDKWADKLKEKLNTFVQGCFSGNCEIPVKEVPPRETSQRKSSKVEPTEEEAPFVEPQESKPKEVKPQEVKPQEVKPQESKPKKDFSIFSTNLNPQQKEQLRNDFKIYLNQNEEAKNNIYNRGNFSTKNIRPNTLNKIPALNIDLPYFILQVNPIHGILFINNYDDDIKRLESELRFQNKTTTSRISFLKALADRININTTNSKFNDFIKTAFNQLQNDKEIKIPPDFWDRIIESQNKLSELPNNLLDQIVEFFMEKDYESVVELIDEVKKMKWVENPEENKTESFTRKTLHNFINEQNKVRFKTSETLYERLLTCLEKMRSN
jgi:hypothetical protein